MIAYIHSKMIVKDGPLLLVGILRIVFLQEYRSADIERWQMTTYPFLSDLLEAEQRYTKPGVDVIEECERRTDPCAPCQGTSP